MALPREAVYYDLDFLIKEAKSLMDHEQQPAKDAVRSTLLRFHPDREAEEKLRYCGLLYLVGNAAGKERAGVVDHRESEERFGPAPRSGRSAAVIPSHADILWRIKLDGADGLHKPVIQFSITDCDRFASWARSQSNAWDARRRAMSRVSKLLRENGKERVNELPINVLGEVREALREGWK